MATAEPVRTREATAANYSRPNPGVAREFEYIVTNIESQAGVVVYRVPMQFARQAATDANASAPLQIALNAAQGPIAVIYPDIGEPYRSVFSTIIEGIEDKAKTRVTSLAVGADTNAQTIANELRRQNIKVVIALGRHGLKIASTLDQSIGVVGGGVISATEGETRAVSVLSLAPDPGLLFQRLKRFAPATKRVFVVYNAQQNGWLIRLAEEAAQFHQIELVAYDVRDLKSAVLRYRDILTRAKPRQDALWLPQDSISVEDTSVLPLILEETWNRSMVVFSSNVAHVRRGALFALYPNNIELGRQLATSALEYLAAQEPAARRLTPLKSVLVAVNIRTANHLGIQMSYQQQSNFDLIFPER